MSRFCAAALAARAELGGCPGLRGGSKVEGAVVGAQRGCLRQVQHQSMSIPGTGHTTLRRPILLEVGSTLRSYFSSH